MRLSLLLNIIILIKTLNAENDHSRVARFTRGNAERKTRFLLFNRRYPDGQLIVPDDESIPQSSFNPALPTRFIIHGFTSSGHSRGVTKIRQAYMQKGDFNIIVVDWGKLSEKPTTALFTYGKVAGSIRHVGEQVAKLAVLLNRVTKASFDNMYIIGHSLGAHIAGFAGKFLQQALPGTKFRTIFGLDPAGPSFIEVGSDYRLSPDDAYYVETIQTDSFKGKLKNLGHSLNLGHATFFPNYGQVQPGCAELACSHQRAWHYFAESINSEEGFYGSPCASLRAVQERTCPPPRTLYKMGGEPAQPKREGIFYVPTNSKYPFAIGQYMVK